ADTLHYAYAEAMSTATKPTQRRRADATRNDERIVDIAIEALSRDPAAGLDDIARAAGIGRTTLHRRYRTRDELMTALRTRARHDLRETIRESRLDEGGAVDALDRLLDNLLAKIGIYRFLVLNPAPTGHRSDRIVARELGALVRRGQDDGVFTTTNPPSWWVEVIQALLVLAVNPPTDVRPRDLPGAIRATLAGGLVRV